MAWKPFVAAAFLCNVALGNVCMLQLAHAMAPQAAKDPLLMSRIDAADCPFLEAESAGTADGGCSDGRCLTVPPHDDTVLSALPLLFTAPSLPAGCGAEAAFPAVDDLSLRPLPESPPPLASVRTVVLRL